MVAQRARIAALEVERDRDIRHASRIARRDITAKYREVLESLKDRWASKKREVSAEIQLQEVTANIDLLTELKDGGPDYGCGACSIKTEWKETVRILSPPPPCRISRSPSSIFLKSQMIRWIKSGGRLSPMIPFLVSFFCLISFCF